MRRWLAVAILALGAANCARGSADEPATPLAPPVAGGGQTERQRVEVTCESSSNGKVLGGTGRSSSSGSLATGCRQRNVVTETGD